MLSNWDFLFFIIKNLFQILEFENLIKPITSQTELEIKNLIKLISSHAVLEIENLSKIRGEAENFYETH